MLRRQTSVMVGSVSTEAILRPVFRCLSHPLQMKQQFMRYHRAE
jgi:hypothetical protein